MVRAGKRLELAKQAVVAAVAVQDRLQEEYNIGSARLEELKKEASATLQMEVRSHGFRERDDLRNVEASGRGCGAILAQAILVKLDVTQ